MTSPYRVCPDTGFKVDLAGEKLIKWNAVTAIVFLAVGGVLGLLVALTRWPQVHLLSADDFYMVLTAHGFVILLVWLLYFEMALLYFASSILLNVRLALPKVAWLGYWLMLIGTIITVIVVLQGESNVMFTSYVPMQADPNFYLGIIVFAVGALCGTITFFATLVVAKNEKTYEGSIPLVTFGAMTAAIIAVFSIGSGAVILIPTYLWSLGFIAYIDPLMYKVVWWALGHGSQQINVAAQIAVWYAIAAILFNAKPLSEKVSRFAFLMYILFLQLASAHHLLVEPGLSSEWKIVNTSYLLYLAVMASMVHGLTVPGAIEAAQRKLGYNNGLFEWIRKAPWGNPVFSGMFLSLILFGVLGGITGVIMGQEQVNIIIHNTLYVPGHFHGTVAAGTTLAFMAITYWLLPVIFQRELFLPGWAKWQPYWFATGVTGISLAMMGAGTLGVSRRHWDITFADAVIKFDHPALAHLMMGINGVFAIIATIGGASFVIVCVGTLLWGKKRGDVPAAAPQPAPAPTPSAVGQHGSAGTIEVPGTFTLALIFLGVFILYYFINWKFLASTWGLS
jgi:cytochrome c oxidase subunit I